MFASSADNLVPGITNASGQWNIFVRDRQSGTTELVSVAANGEPANRDSSSPAISADGRYVAFASSGVIWVRDRQTGVTEAVSVGANGAPANGGSYSPAISADGRFVAFASDASNLVPGDDNGRTDVFVAERG